ncbi:WAP four-disulfide core domain protein 2-like isoform X1 [Pezoporus occidentalis]|uniref:WAP four-disulfide core domain protein 2-like isoform X1 n=1 Tax=Pezoporus occidentalis TaxID=407982 RepID=UPI002F91829D
MKVYVCAAPPQPHADINPGDPRCPSVPAGSTMKAAIVLLLGILALCTHIQPDAAAPANTAKAGVCPDPATEAVNCTVGCQSDGDCESTLKCCPAACGKACQKPDEKPGTCPPVSPGIPMLGVCTNQCKSDSNCSGNQKCCRNGCGKVSCVTPLH